jgi:hypothetical protein
LFSLDLPVRAAAPDPRQEKPKGDRPMKTIAISPETMQARIARFAEVKPSRETRASIVPDVVTNVEAGE